MDSELVFRDSCVPINRLDCYVGTRLINPCSCQSYYWCITVNSIIVQPCAKGDFYDHTIKGCNLVRDVEYTGICSPHKPWQQCANITNVNVAELEVRCNATDQQAHLSSHLPSHSPPLPSHLPSRLRSTTITTHGTPSVTDDTSVNSGLIVGTIVASSLFVIILGILVFCWYKRQKTARWIRSQQGSLNNPSYFSKPETIDSVYASIDDMIKPGYTADNLSNLSPRNHYSPPSRTSTASTEISLYPNVVLYNGTRRSPPAKDYDYEVLVDTAPHTTHL